MTSIGSEKLSQNRVLPMKMPSYSFNYPVFERVQLAAVKDGIFHPNLPSFRRMDMDTARHKLPDEHCRTTSSYGPGDFQKATSTLFTPPSKRLSSLGVTDTGKQMHRYYTTPDELKNTRQEWSNFLNKSPERFGIKLPALPDNKDFHFSGYAVRYLRPEVTQSWKYTLRQEPMLSQYDQRPIPANIYARYRDSHPQYSRNIATEAWRNP